MSQRVKVKGTRSIALWILTLIAAVLVIGLVVGVLIVYPNHQSQQQVEQHYQAGVAFQETGDWDKAVEAFEQVVAIDADYNDIRTRLVEVRTKQQAAQATAQAEAVQATATAQAQTMVAAATVTAEALTELEDTYQKCLGAMNLERWADAKEACDQVFAIDPNYKDVQDRLNQTQAELDELQSPTLTVLASSPTPNPSTPTPTPQVVRVEIHANGEWQEAGLFVRAGQRIDITASGTWSHGREGGDMPFYSPKGYEKYDDNALLPTARIGSLLGRIGNRRPFLVGRSYSLVADRGGSLYLSMNDAAGTFGNNEGSISVRIEAR